MPETSTQDFDLALSGASRLCRGSASAHGSGNWQKITWGCETVLQDDSIFAVEFESDESDKVHHRFAQALHWQSVQTVQYY